MSVGFESARLKVVRAIKIRSAAAELIESYEASQPYEVVTDGSGRETLRITNTPPPEIAVLVDEVIATPAFDFGMHDLD